MKRIIITQLSSLLEYVKTDRDERIEDVVHSEKQNDEMNEIEEKMLRLKKVVEWRK